MRLFAAAVLGRWQDVRKVRGEAGPDEPDRAWRETVLMVHLFAGFPRQVETYGVLAAAGGLGVPAADECEATVDQPDRGRRLFEQIYGDQSNPVEEALRAGHPDVPGWIIGHAYGRVLTRPGLTPRQRELLATAALAVSNQSRQLVSHVRGAIRCGGTVDDLRAVVDTLGPLLEPAGREDALATIERFGRAESPKA